MKKRNALNREGRKNKKMKIGLKEDVSDTEYCGACVKPNDDIIGWFNKHNIISDVCVFFILIMFASIQNWSILVGENLMKWDIWDAEYPLQVMMSDAIANHTIPMWNPLMRYGIPNYAMVGTPVWYPFTMLLACIGYTPIVLAVSYVMHIVIGGFGMFLLAGKELKGKNKNWNRYNLITSVVVGLIYCSSGMALSNAQHIMIIISMAWVPYVFYYSRRYLEEKNIVFAMSAGLCAGLIFLGGYPEMFYDLFLFLVPYILFFNYDKERKASLNIIYSAERYLVIVGFTIAASAISLLPFLKNMSLITRGTGLGEVPQNYSVATFLSMLLPKTTQFIQGVEISMVNYYIGLIVILLIPIMIVRANSNKKIYFMLVIVAAFLCMGNKSFLHPLLYHFFPMYDSFRFPTLNRCFLAVFLLLLFSPVFNEVLKNGVDLRTIKCSKLLLGIMGILAVVCMLIGNMASEMSEISIVRCLELAESAFISAGFIAVYLFIFILMKSCGGNKIEYMISLVCTVCVELLVFAYMEGPITITCYQYTEYSYNPGVQEHIKSTFENNKNRNKGVDFAGQARSTSGLDSQSIVFNKTFDEEGYLSFRLKSTNEFKNTYFRNIIEQNPVIYFTNDTISSKDVDYNLWVNACGTSPGQIYVEDALTKGSGLVNGLSSEVVEVRNLNLSSQEGVALIEDNLSSGGNKTGRIRVFFEENAGNSVNLSMNFTDINGGEQAYTGEFQLHELESGEYADIYFPDVNQEYQSLRITADELPISAELVDAGRTLQDKYAHVNRFGFNDIEVDVDAPTEGYVTILQSYHDGWSAYVDGEKAEISLVNQCFMGIYVEPGAHTIEMRFRPKEFLAGMIITLINFVGSAVAVVRYCKKKK